MTPELLAAVPSRHALSPWDREELSRLAGRRWALEGLRAAMATAGYKVEQEVLQEDLLRALQTAASAQEVGH